MELPKSKLNSASNVKRYGPFPGSYRNETVYVMVRYDDTCGNGHNSLGITCAIYDKGRWSGGGCRHDLVAEVMPEIEYLIRWHLMSTDGPSGYIADTLYHADDKDYNGLRKGETEQIVNGNTGKLCWVLERSKKLPKYVDSNTLPKNTALLKYVPWLRTGEGKAIDLDAARRSAVWPDAELKDLTEESLKARLPELMQQFKADIERAGFEY